MTYKQCKDYIRSDYYRVLGKRGRGILQLYLLSMTDIGFRFLFWFRLTKCDILLLSFFARLMYMHLRLKHKIDIDRHTEIGYGFLIKHGGPIVINCSCHIGDNVDIYQNTTIGSSFCKAASIGNNVYIGPSVCIVEDVHIGDGVTIGAGAVVVKDVEAGSTIAGNPAKVISEKEPGRLVWRRWDNAWNKV